mmetsp:Transcript_11758/g.19953  ORF Transcript_11758/g.19953 Transcript_11758/m.19953 type:complete len:248 (+) Transcript_11758:281-1024(+)|eukprot:CAMPEP_0198197332 /NCGR_PEP_ID=MMETSP1445-20131203/939_1 /TAXON_ID=36898 /ORGANISM="Pyramimonas sp., Strain CCMP2087" /LENGTH=247 /DNA_ID=CAMNT_0043866591 /DNA_START=239 /DNA_END=982 /DNA_ORIENTATION=+
MRWTALPNVWVRLKDSSRPLLTRVFGLFRSRSPRLPIKGISLGLSPVNVIWILLLLSVGAYATFALTRLFAPRLPDDDSDEVPATRTVMSPPPSSPAGQPRHSNSATTGIARRLRPGPRAAGTKNPFRSVYSEALASIPQTAALQKLVAERLTGLINGEMEEGDNDKLGESFQKVMSHRQRQHQVKAARQAIIEMVEPEVRKERAEKMEQAVRERMSQSEADRGFSEFSSSKRHTKAGDAMVELNIS